MNAEQAYRFRHALFRDAAYQLQLPSERARLHGLAFQLIERLAGGRPADGPPLSSGESESPPHALDPFAAELAEHARHAQLGQNRLKHWRDCERFYLVRAAEHAARHFLNTESNRLWLALAALSNGVDKAEALRRASNMARKAGMPQDAMRRAFEQAGVPPVQA